MSAIPARLLDVRRRVRAVGADADAAAAAGSRQRRAPRRRKWALFVGGFAVFAMFYGPQPLLPLFGSAFGLDAAQASGVLSATAGAMALGPHPGRACSRSASARSR